MDSLIIPEQFNIGVLLSISDMFDKTLSDILDTFDNPDKLHILDTFDNLHKFGIPRNLSTDKKIPDNPDIFDMIILDRKDQIHNFGIFFLLLNMIGTYLFDNHVS